MYSVFYGTDRSHNRGFRVGLGPPPFQGGENMKAGYFTVRRTSQEYFHEDRKPCDEAFIAPVSENPWGKHSQEIYKEDGRVWAVQIEDLESLLRFVEKYGRCIISSDDKMDYLEIYDDFRET